jgi:hypothetical protein
MVGGHELADLLVENMFFFSTPSFRIPRARKFSKLERQNGTQIRCAIRRRGFSRRYYGVLPDLENMVLLFYSLLLPCVLVPTAAASLEHYCTYVVVYFLSSYPYYPTTMATSNSLTNQLLVTVGLLADCLVIGAPVWVFFLQSPALFAFMGRSKFIPPMMRLTKVLFHWTLPVWEFTSTMK